MTYNFILDTHNHGDTVIFDNSLLSSGSCFSNETFDSVLEEVEMSNSV